MARPSKNALVMEIPTWVMVGGVWNGHIPLSMSHIASTTPVIVTLVFAVIAWAATKTRHERLSGEEIYRYPPFVGWLMAGCGCLFLCLPFLGGEGDVPPLLFFSFFAVWGALAFAAAVYFFRYRVIVGDKVLRLGTLRFESVPIADVIDTDITTGGRNVELLVYLKTGRRLEFSSLLGDFASLADTLDNRANRAPGTGASIQKLEDQRRRVTLVRRLNWVVGIAAVVGAIVGGIVWLGH
jgi:hypothetical protein